MAGANKHTAPEELEVNLPEFRPTAKNASNY
jgi:hypothetical protein